MVGVGTIVVSWWTGDGDIAGASLIAAGSKIYTVETAFSEIGNVAKFMGGESAGNYAISALSAPLKPTKFLGALFVDKTLDAIKDKNVSDPCE